MKLLLCLCLVICFKDVVLQLNCYRCPISSLTEEYFRAHNCFFVHDRNSYLCCVPTTSSISCNVRRKRNVDPNFTYFSHSYSTPIINNPFPDNPIVKSLNTQFTNYVQQNSPNTNHLHGLANEIFQANNYYNNIPQSPTFAQPNFQQSRSFFQQHDTNNYFAQPGPYVRQSSPPFQLSLPYQPSNNFFNPRDNIFPQSLANVNNIDHARNNANKNYPYFDPNISLFNPILSARNFSSVSIKSPNVDAEESSHSEYFPVAIERPSKVEDIKQTPIKRSLTKTKETPLTDLHKHRNFDLLPLNEACGLQEYPDRIFGGEEASIGEFPWMSLLEYSFNGRNIGFKCAGILINNRYVLTAAHCIAGRTITSQENLIRVRLGEHDMSTEVDCEENNNCNDPPLNVEVEEVILHHDYHEMDRNLHNDIALVRLSKKIQYTDFVKPICLPLQGERTNPGENMRIVGWGLKIEDLPSHVKQTATIPYTNDTECKELWKDVVEIIDSQFCAGGKSKTNVCRGDSGGPIMSTFPGDEQWYVEGIVSFGKIPCGGETFPSVYTRVSSYITWILDNIKE